MHSDLNHIFIVFIITLSIARAQINPCDGSPGAIIPNPNNCHGFIMCLVTDPTYFDCPKGHVFSTQTLECLPGNRDTCELHDLEVICRGVFFQARPYPDDHDDRLFIGCIKSQPSIQTCNNDEFFDREINQCDGFSRTTTLTNPTTTSTTENPPVNPCSGVQSGKI